MFWQPHFLDLTNWPNSVRMFVFVLYERLYCSRGMNRIQMDPNVLTTRRHWHRHCGGNCRAHASTDCFARWKNGGRPIGRRGVIERWRHAGRRCALSDFNFTCSPQWTTVVFPREARFSITCAFVIRPFVMWSKMTIECNEELEIQMFWRRFSKYPLKSAFYIQNELLELVVLSLGGQFSYVRFFVRLLLRYMLILILIRPA